MPQWSTDLEEAIAHPETDTVDRRPAERAARGGGRARRRGTARRCSARSRSRAPREEAKRILDIVESAGIFAGYLEDLAYTPKTLKALAHGAAGRDRRRHVGALARDASGPAQRVVLGREAGRRRADRRPRLPLHRDRPQLHRQGQPAARGDVLGGHARPPDRGRGQRDRADPVRVGRDRPVRGQLDVPRRHGPARRGRRHRGHDLAQPLPAHRLRGVQLGRGRRLRRREGGDRERLALPGGRRGRRARLRRHVHRHVRRDGRGPRADGDVLRRLRRQRDHRRLLPLGGSRGNGSRSSSTTGAAAACRGSRAPRREPTARR